MFEIIKLYLVLIPFNFMDALVAGIVAGFRIARGKGDRDVLRDDALRSHNVRLRKLASLLNFEGI